MVCEDISASSLSYKHVHALKSAVYREMCKLRPTIPNSIEDVFSAAESPAFGLDSFDVIRDEPNKILIITSEHNLLHLSACENILGEGLSNRVQRFLNSCTHCTGTKMESTVRIELTLDQGPKVRNTCGVLTCKEDINVSVSSTSGNGIADSSVTFSSILNMSVFIRDTKNAKGQQDMLLGAVSPKEPMLTRVSNGRKVNGLLEPGQARVRVDLEKQEDCEAQYVCHIRGLDNQGKEAVVVSNLVKQPSQGPSQAYSVGAMPTTSLDLLLDGLETRIGDTIMSIGSKVEEKVKHIEARTVEMHKDMATRGALFENRMEDRIAQLQKDLTANSNTFEHYLDTKLDAFENRVEDKIDSNNCNKLEELDAKISTQLSTFGTAALRNILNSLDSMARTIHGEQTQALVGLSHILETTLKNIIDLLASMKGDLGLIKSFSQTNLMVVRNETQTILELLTAAENMSACLHNGSYNTDTGYLPTVCYRGMNNSNTQNYPPYIFATLEGQTKEFLCDTKTDQGGWIVIQSKLNKPGRKLDSNFTML
ncbi:hypothetical protein ElyMa_006765300 [Elysia marginata]|uniref:Fibrinogen C-terminal domain-containing protein n=1 Tax=Elysia marginata TaxID=1093978 RepID=A0AAV4IYV4_9GAST|nr:hypothetical protein ElyMa_006765300 [Elysia marginata]